MISTVKIMLVLYSQFVSLALFKTDRSQSHLKIIAPVINLSLITTTSSIIVNRY